MKRILFTIYLVCFFALTAAIAQTRIVTGRVIAVDDGEAMPGVTINIKGTPEAVVSDADGKFRISAKTGDVLHFSFVGYTAVDIPIVNGVSTYPVKLTIDTHTLAEVVSSTARWIFQLHPARACDARANRFQRKGSART